MTLFPMKFCRITAPFHYYTVNGVRSMHYALDLASYTKDPTVTAVHGGEVLSSFYDAAGGNMVVLRGAFAGEMDILTRYAHLASRSVKQGDVVAAGQKIGTQGNTGSQTTGQHLHFEVWILPDKTPYAFSQRPQFAIDPLSLCHLTEAQVFERNGKTEFSAIPQPEPKVELRALADAKYSVFGSVEMFFYPDNRFSPIVGGAGREKRYLGDFLDEREFEAIYSYAGGGAEWAGILTRWGLLWAPVIAGRSALAIIEPETHSPAEEPGDEEGKEPAPEEEAGDEKTNPAEEDVEGNDPDEDGVVDEREEEAEQEDGTPDGLLRDKQRHLIWSSALRILTAVFDAMKSMLRRG